MTTVTRRARLGPDDVEAIRAPRCGLIEERADADGSFSAVRGPVASYCRRVSVASGADGAVEVTQTVEYRLAVPLLGWLVGVPVRRRLTRIAPDNGPPWWGPPDVLDAAATAALTGLLTLATVLGYLGTLLTQTITYSTKEFHVGTAGEGVALAVARADIVVALALVALADRRGRRSVALGGAAAGCVLTALGALSPSLAWLTASQVLARGFVTSATIASSVLLAETMPKGARAWAFGVTAMAAAVGAGTCVVALPITGLGVRAWRVLFVAALLWLGLVAVARRHVVESERFELHRHDSPGARPPVDRSRLALLAAANFFLMAFVTPASEFQNEYLRRERHFSPSRIALFVLVTVFPGAIGIVVGGRLADTRGRRVVATASVIGVTLFGVAAFSIGGWPMWVTTALAATTGSAVTPALNVYGSELFATGRRGAANGMLTAAGRAGAVVGLLTVGGLSQALGKFGPAFAVLSIGPVLLVVLIVTRFPETARRSLEELNPGDAEPGNP